MAILLMAVALPLGGCSATKVAAPGPFVGLGGNPMAMLKIYSTDPSGHPLTRDQYQKVVDGSKQCFEQLGWQRSTVVESMLASGLAYGAMGAAGGATQGIFYAGADAGAAAGYIGIVQALAGSVNGAQTASYDMVNGIAKCVDDTIRDSVLLLGERDMAFVHVVGSYVRSRNSDDPARPLARHLYNGARVGEPIRRAERY